VRCVVVLELYDNQLTGQLPTTFQYLTDLEMLNLDGNKFWGPLPTEFGALTKLDILDLSNNELSGTIPTEIGLLTNLGMWLRTPTMSRIGGNHLSHLIFFL
jgi:Leucine-rich repeat (LRR) protein